MEIPKWTGELIGKMHNNRISSLDLAKSMGVCKDYVSMVLNGKKTPKGAQERFEAAVDAIIAERREANV